MLKLKLERKPTNPNEDRAKLRGEKIVRILGVDISVKSIKRLPKIGRFRTRRVILGGDWSVYKEEMREIFSIAVKDWGGLEYEDIWRDPSVAFFLYNKVIRG